ncbi:hypothetical protein L3X38_008862 [Prunus dulcis]|uniref:Uncharacterized protein n=1 Tax=Prunus dulcis TaxID=3755 RepID=A0AAD5F7B2_PRUDU|nr:hypothetical protein L3X38_008862 [Prunus dulcis]
MSVERIPFGEQISNFQSTLDQITDNLGADDVAQAINCIFFVGMGNNYYLNNYLMPNYPKRTQFNAPQFSDLLKVKCISRAYPSISFLQFPCVENKITLIPISVLAIASDFTRNDPHVRLALQEISKSSAIRAFIIDIFCSSALTMAKELGIPTYYFYTSSAGALAVFLYFQKIGEQTTNSFKDLTETVFEFPGLKSPLNAPHMPEPMLDRDDPAYWDMVYFCTHLPKSNGIIANTFEELEPPAVLKAIAGGLCVPDAPTPYVHYIGPLISEEKEFGDSAEAEDCLSWLDQQPSRSVVFLCFGNR